MKQIEILKSLTLIPAFIFGLPTNMIWLLVVFIFIDTLTGVILSFIVDGKRSIRSRILATGAISKGLSIVVPLMLASLSGISEVDFVFLAKGLLGVLLIAELYSTTNNIISIRKKKRLHEIDAFSFVLLKLQKTLLKMSGYKDELPSNLEKRD